MKVTLLNKEESQRLFESWGTFAKVCYDTKTNKPQNIGKHCMNSGHFSGSRSRYFEFLIEDCPRFTIDQCARHEQGVCKNIQSFRYVSKNSFAYEIPIEILDNKDLLDEYHNHMVGCIQLYSNIQEYVKTKTRSKERANEQARYVLPMSTHSSFVIGFTIEALIHLMNERLCVRTEDIFRELAMLMKEEVLEVLPQLDEVMVPQCVNMLYCPEQHGCGAYLNKKELINKLNNI